MNIVLIAQNRVETTALAIVFKAAQGLELTRRLLVAEDALRPLIDRRATVLVFDWATARLISNSGLSMAQIFIL